MKRFLLLLVFFSSIFGSALSLVSLRMNQELPSCCYLSDADLGYPFAFLSSEKDLYRTLKCDSFKCPYKNVKKPLVKQYSISNADVDYYPLAHISTGLFWAGTVFVPFMLLYGVRKHGAKVHQTLKTAHSRFSFKKHEHRIPIYKPYPEMPVQIRPPVHPPGHHPVPTIDEEINKGP